MNKLYTSALAVALTSGAAMAQTRTVDNSNRNIRPVIDNSVVLPSSNNDRVAIWSDDFSNASTWTISHDGVEALDWQIGVGLVNTGSFTTPPIESTTAANGYGMLDSDGFGNTTTNYEKSNMTTATPIDLSAYPNVILEFQNQYRPWQDEQPYVVISTNNTDWPVLDPATDISTLPNVFYVWEPGELTTSVSPGNPTTKRINISAVAGGQPTVWVRFAWTGIYGYSWFVDDVNISEQPMFDAAMRNSFLSETGFGEEYGRIPTSQLPTEMNVGGDLVNYGVNALTNATIIAEVRDAANTLMFSATTSIPTLPSGDTLHLDEMVALPVLPVGLYTGTFTATSDENASDGLPENNTYLRTFEVTTDLYSIDEIGSHPPGYEVLNAIGTQTFTGGEDGLITFSYYPVLNTMTVYGIQFMLASGSVEGGTAIVSLRDTLNVLPPNNDVGTTIAVSDDHIISAADIASGLVGVAFSTPVVLPPGHYFAGVEMYSNGNANDFRILDDITVPQPTWTSAIYIPAAQTYSNGNAIAIQVSSNPAVGISEHHDLQGVNLYPNPSTGLVTVYSNSSKNYLVEVMNVMGETILTNHVNGNTTMDLTSLAKGLYTVRVSDSKASMAQRLVLN